jgi:PadR family transcriptional regulator PadR
MAAIQQSEGEWGAQLRRGVLELCILALLGREPSYGYQIVTQIASAPQLATGEGTIYPLLRRLKREGLVETFWQESAAGPPRQYYRLTAKGRGALRAMRAEWEALVAAMGLHLNGQTKEGAYEHRSTG